MTKKKYSRQQAIKLAASSSSRLSYLERLGLVIPEKIGDEDTKKPVVLYTAEQIAQIKLIDAASKFLHVEGIKAAIAKDCLDKVVKILTELLNDDRSS